MAQSIDRRSPGFALATHLRRTLGMGSTAAANESVFLFFLAFDFQFKFRWKATLLSKGYPACVDVPGTADMQDRSAVVLSDRSRGAKILRSTSHINRSSWNFIRSAFKPQGEFRWKATLPSKDYLACVVRPGLPTCTGSIGRRLGLIDTGVQKMLAHRRASTDRAETFPGHSSNPKDA